MNANEALEQVRAEVDRFPMSPDPDEVMAFIVKVDAILDAVTPEVPVKVETVEELKALPSRAAVMDKLGDVGVLGVGGIYYPETAPVSLEYAVKHWGPFTVLTPATAQSGAES